MKMLEILGLIEEHKMCIMGNIMTLMKNIRDNKNLMEEMYGHQCKEPSVVAEILYGTTASTVPASAIPATQTTVITVITTSTEQDDLDVLSCNLL